MSARVGCCSAGAPAAVLRNHCCPFLQYWLRLLDPNTPRWHARPCGYIGRGPYGADHSNGDCVACREHRCQFCGADADSCETCQNGEQRSLGGAGACRCLPLTQRLSWLLGLESCAGTDAALPPPLPPAPDPGASYALVHCCAGYLYDEAANECRPCLKPHCGHCSSSGGEEVCDGCKPGYRLIDSNDPLDRRCIFDADSWGAAQRQRRRLVGARALRRPAAPQRPGSSECRTGVCFMFCCDSTLPCAGSLMQEPSQQFHDAKRELLQLQADRL